MNSVNNQTEKEYRDSQTTFGHIHQSKGLIEWLTDTYASNTSKEKRYKKVAENYLDTSQKMNVFEIAAGVGDFVSYCAKLFPQHNYYANEISDKQLGGNITAVAKYFGINKTAELNFGPVEKLTHGNNMFDLVFVKAAVHHFEDPEKGFAEIYRILRPKGRLVFFEDPICLNIPIYKQRVE